MGTEYKHFLAGEATYPTSNGAELKEIAGTNFPIQCLAFDAATQESAFLEFIADNYSSGNLTLDLIWEADTAGSGDVVFGGQIAAITPNTDTQDLETKAFATANTVTDSHLGTTNQRLHMATITISNLDSIAAGDYVKVKIYRDAAAGGDTMAGDCNVLMARISYATP